ncbi:MAG: efflux RND transporter periplasmic adaptor subunit [Verrucomicrobiota bacterium]
MKTLKWVFSARLLLGVGFAGTWLAGCRPNNTTQEKGVDDTHVIAQVELAPVVKSNISETVTAYGSVIPRPGATHAVSVRFESVVDHLLVAAGEAVTNGQVLADIEPSAASKLQLAQAKIAVDAADRELKQTQERYDLKFATNQELGQARKAADDARLQLQSLEDRGIETERQVKSQMAGVIWQLSVRDGQIVSAATPLFELIARNEIEVRLGVEPEDAVSLSKDDRVTLFPVHAAEARQFEGRIRLITQRVNPDTHLVDVYVRPPSGMSLLLDAYLRAEIKTVSHEALLVPRLAVLPQGNHDVIFTVENGHALEHQVQIGIKTTNEVEVISPKFQPGVQVVVQGNYELTNGMAVAPASKP